MDKERQAPAPESLRVVMYVRSATINQVASDKLDGLDEQAAAIERYAERNGMQIVRRYVDDGCSGLKQGPKQKEMLNAVQTGTADFSAILMRDISRWGRFQDCDVSAYCEYLCRIAGIEVRYVWEEENAKGIVSLMQILGSIKSALAR